MGLKGETHTKGKINNGPNSHLFSTLHPSLPPSLPRASLPQNHQIHQGACRPALAGLGRYSHHHIEQVFGYREPVVAPGQLPQALPVLREGGREGGRERCESGLNINTPLSLPACCCKWFSQEGERIRGRERGGREGGRDIERKRRRKSQTLTCRRKQPFTTPFNSAGVTFDPSLKKRREAKAEAEPAPVLGVVISPRRLMYIFLADLASAKGEGEEER